jgi:hypothetical protein
MSGAINIAAFVLYYVALFGTALLAVWQWLHNRMIGRK